MQAKTEERSELSISKCLPVCSTEPVLGDQTAPRCCDQHVCGMGGIQAGKYAKIPGANL